MIKHKKKIVCIFAFFAILFSFTLLSMISVTAVKSEKPSKADIFVAKENIIKIEANSKFVPEAKKGGTAIYVESKGKTSKIEYKLPINIEGLTKNDDIISVVPIGGERYSSIKRINLTLTDLVDPQNTVGIQYKPAIDNKPDESDCCYVLANYKGAFRGINDTDGSIYTDSYGAVYWGGSLSTVTYGPSDFSLNIDAEKRQVWLHQGSTYNLILNLLNPLNVGSGNEWKGFNNNLAMLSVEIESMSSDKPCAYYITEVMGHSLAGEITNTDKTTPIVTIRATPEFLTNLPACAKNAPYTLPSAYARDWFSGNEEVSVNVFKGDVDVTATELNGFIFTPSSATDYTIVYSATNKNGKSTKELHIDVDEILPQYHVLMTKPIKQPKLFEYFEFPTIAVAGGSGELSFTEQIQYNNRFFNLDNTRLVYLNEAGTITLIITVKGYCGNEYVKRYLYDIKADTLNIEVSGVPYALKKGVKATLPKPIMHDFSGKSSAENITLTFDGQSVKDYAVTPTKVGINQLVYTATKGETIKTLSFSVMVFEANNQAENLIIERGNAKPTINGNAKINATTDATVSLPFPLPIVDTNLIFSIDSGDFDSLDIVLQDFYNPEIYKFVKITPKNKLTSYMQINGVGEKFIIDGGFYSGNLFNLIFDSRNSRILSASGKLITQTALLPSNIAKISFMLNGVKKESTLGIKQIANQVFGGLNAEPIVYTRENIPIATFVNINTTIHVPSASVYDVFDFMGEVSMQIIAPDKSILYNGICKSQNFVANAYGFYKVKYIAMHKNAPIENTYNFKVIDRITPKLTLSEALVKTIKVGKPLTLPTMTTSDNMTANVKTYILMFNLTTYNREVIEPTKPFMFKTAGNYELIFCAVDDEGNTTTIKQSITVSK